MFREVVPKVSSVRKFYFLEYFYILLNSVNRHDNYDKIFESFNKLKDSFQLGNSKYKKLSSSDEHTEINHRQKIHYQYTFNQVTEEAKTYGLINYEERLRIYRLTEKGQNLLSVYEKRGLDEFNLEMFKLIEANLFGFYELVSVCYRANASKGGLLVFPTYSPLALGFDKKGLQTTRDIHGYVDKLIYQLQKELISYSVGNFDLTVQKDNLFKRLFEAGLLKYGNNSFDQKDYYSMIKRIRDFWLNYFLKEIYKTNYSLSYFEIWVYRAHQLGIVNVTDFYPGFSGRIIYPTSLLLERNATRDFTQIYEYEDGKKLYLHKPSWNEKFVDILFDSYYDLKKSNKSYDFINLADIRDVVCYKMRVSNKTFEEFLTEAYVMNLKNELRIKISLEVDKKTEETNAMYLRREPVMIDGKQRNIIAIELKK